MTPDVLVRRCTLTIRRRGGWSWGPDPRRHLEEALKRVEAAISAAIAEAGLGDDAELRLRGPVRIELARGDDVPHTSWRELVARLREELARAEAAGDEFAEAESRDDRRPADTDEPRSTAIIPAPAAAAALARTLARWARAGRLAGIAAAWPSAVVRCWLEALRIAAARPGAPVGVLADEAVDRIAEAVVGLRERRALSRDMADVELLVLLGALAAALADRIPAARVQLRADSVVLGDIEPRESDVDSPTPTSTAAPSRLPEETRSRSTSAARGAQPDVVSALPFLVLVELTRIGYADAVGAASAVASGWMAPGLGAALAGKVLPRPDRDWRRRSADAAAVALAAGVPNEDVANELATLAARTDEVLPSLRAALEGAYAEGRSSKEEVLVTTCEHGILCGEETGLLPAAWVAAHDELDDVLASLDRPPARRGDSFAGLAAVLHECSALPRLDAPALERHLGAAVGTALGLLALELWSETGPTSPMLALDRLASLRAHVRVMHDGLAVAVPRGQRWLDLRRAELLGEYAVVWLPGGRLEIGTW